MAKFELPIYGENDETIKIYKADVIKYKTFLKAMKIKDEIENAEADKIIELVNSVVKSVFPGLTDDELSNADITDVFSTYKQAVNLAALINTSKN